MTDIDIYFGVTDTRLNVVVTINGQREFYHACNVFVDFTRKLIKFDTEIYDRRIEFDNIAIAHNVKEHIKIKEYDEE